MRPAVRWTSSSPIGWRSPSSRESAKPDAKISIPSFSAPNAWRTAPARRYGETETPPTAGQTGAAANRFPRHPIRADQDLTAGDEILVEEPAIARDPDGAPILIGLRAVAARVLAARTALVSFEVIASAGHAPLPAGAWVTRRRRPCWPAWTAWRKARPGEIAAQSRPVRGGTVKD